MYKLFNKLAFLTPRCIFGKYNLSRPYIKSIIRKIVDSNTLYFDTDAKNGVLTSRLLNLALTYAQSDSEYTIFPKVEYNRYITKIYVSSYNFIKPVKEIVKMCCIEVIVEPDLTSMFLEEDNVSLACNDSELILFEFNDGEHSIGSF